MRTYEEKKELLNRFMDEYLQSDCIVAFSGGTDSSLLLKLACESAKKTGSKVYAVTIHTKLHPMKDLEIARRVAGETGAEHIILEINELDEAGIENNPKDRCYRCKKCLFQKMRELAGEKKVATIMEGTNEDDLHQYRPGIRALRELKIASPLAEAEFTKKEVRQLAGEFGISVADRPSNPCLATRFPYQTLLSFETMRKVEAGEELIRNLGFYNVRIRVHDHMARIEVDEESLQNLLEHRDKIISFLKQQGFEYITVDMEGFRSGSMDMNLND